MRTLANYVAAFFIFHFFWSYYRNCYRKGYRIDYWHLSLFQMLFVTSVMLPFNRSPLNVIAFGPILLKRALPWVNQAFLISALGYGSVILGGSLWRVKLNLGIRKAYSDLLNQPVRVALLLLRSPRLLMLSGMGCFLMMCAILGVYFRVAGFGFNLESLLIVRPELRPVAQFAAFIAITVGGLALGRYEIRRERSMLVITLLLAGALIFYGARDFLLAIIQLPLLVWMIRRRTRLKLVYLVGIFGFGLFSSVFLDALRHHNLSLSRVVLNAGMSIAFGNSFSDTRDFALVLSFWNHTYFAGKTYLAGLLAFIPRFLLPFRDHWSLGVVTATMAGFSPMEHPGLRVGSSGEAYLNFGIPAVIVLGVAVGSVMKLVDMRVKEAITHDPYDVRVYAYFFLVTFAAAFINSVNFSSVYTIALFLLLSAAVILVSRFIKLPLG